MYSGNPIIQLTREERKTVSKDNTLKLVPVQTNNINQHKTRNVFNNPRGIILLTRNKQ
jgi:hypothetical protein